MERHNACVARDNPFLCYTPPHPSYFHPSTTHPSYNTPPYTQTNHHVTRDPITTNPLFPTSPSTQLHNGPSYQPIPYPNPVSQDQVGNQQWMAPFVNQVQGTHSPTHQYQISPTENYWFTQGAQNHNALYHLPPSQQPHAPA